MPNKLSDPVFKLPGSRALDDFPAEHIVCHSAYGPVTWAEFRQSVQQWQSTICDAVAGLESMGLEPACVAVYHSNAAEFLAILLAVWRSGGQVVVPPNTVRATEQALGEMASLYVGEFSDEVSPLSKPAAKHKGKPLCDSENGADSNAPALHLFTSGSTGHPEIISKSLAQMGGEISMFQQRWPKNFDGLVSVATVSHHHLYGLSFHLLWSLVAGRPFYAAELRYLESLVPLLENHEVLLFSSPAHLAKIPTSVNWLECSEGIRQVFSSAAPLPLRSAQAAQELLGSEPIEIYGSTETGAVAWRTQTRESAWQTLPGVSCDAGEEQLLSIKSPALPEGSIFLTADRVSFSAAGLFELHGRADKIVKLAGKRISLSAVEAALNSEPWVDESRVIPHANRANRLCAVVKMKAIGSAALIDQGILAVQRQLKDALRAQLDGIALPRYWRFVHDMPVNSQGKTTAFELHDLFNKNALTKEPEIRAEGFNEDKSHYYRELYVSSRLASLQGHFPGLPVLPGVVQVSWAEQAGREMFSIEHSFAGLEAVKFQRVILPDTCLRMQLMFDEATLKLYFVFSAGENICSQGRLVFRASE